jgi:hypothetical protein
LRTKEYSRVGGFAAKPRTRSRGLSGGLRSRLLAGLTDDARQGLPTGTVTETWGCVSAICAGNVTG